MASWRNLLFTRLTMKKSTSVRNQCAVSKLPWAVVRGKCRGGLEEGGALQGVGWGNFMQKGIFLSTKEGEEGWCCASKYSYRIQTKISSHSPLLPRLEIGDNHRPVLQSPVFPIPLPSPPTTSITCHDNLPENRRRRRFSFSIPSY